MQVDVDTFGCLSKLLDGIQDHSSFAQLGIQCLVFIFKKLVRGIDGVLSMLFNSRCTAHALLMFKVSNVDGLMEHFFYVQCTLRNETTLKIK